MSAARRVAVITAVCAIADASMADRIEAQSAPNDSARAARDHYRAAVQANRAHDLDAAWLAANRAAAMWPAQIAYRSTVALLAARRGDAPALTTALRGLAVFEAGADILSDSAIMRMSAAPDVANAISALRASVRDVVRSDAFITLRDSTMFPEGMDVDARTGNVYVGSIRHRTVLERRPDGTERELFARGQPNLGGVFGVRVDPKGGVLWATTSTEVNAEGATAGEPQIAALLQVRIADGVILRRWDVPASPTGHTLGDLAVAASGDVFVTDSRSPFVYRLRRGADTLETITNPLFRSLQGVAPTSDGRALYLADYSHGLLRLDLASGTVRVLEHDASFSVLGLDGIALHRGSIVAVQNGVAPARVVRYTLDASGTRIIKVTTLDRNPVADEPTIGAIANGAFVYVANSSGRSTVRPERA